MYEKCLQNLKFEFITTRKYLYSLIYSNFISHHNHLNTITTLKTKEIGLLYLYKQIVCM